MGDRYSANDIERIGAIVKNHGQSAALGALALDVLTRQAEGRTLFAGRDFVTTRAGVHGVTAESAETSLGNVFELLASGPTNATERGLVMAFAVRGLATRIAGAEDDGARTAAVSDFARHADWLSVATDYAAYAFVDEVLDAELREPFWAAVGEGLLSMGGDDGGAPDVGALGRGAARLSALDACRSPAARGVLSRLARESKDPFLARMAQALVGEVSTASALASVSGMSTAPRRGLVRTVLRWITGWALVMGVLRAAAWLCGLRRHLSLSLLDGRVRVHAETRWFGRVIRDRVVVHPIYAVTAVERGVRFPWIRLSVGLFALAAGVLAGGALLAVGVRTGETYVALLGAGVLAAGVLTDFVLDVALPGAHGRVYLSLHAEPRVRLALTGTLAEIDTFLDVLEQRLARAASRPTK